MSKISFVLGSTIHGPMIFSRLDANYVTQANQTVGYGMGHQLMEKGQYDEPEVRLLKQLLALRHKHFHDGVVALDCGANIGVHTIEWGRMMQGWGQVISFEAQEKIYYALAGNVVLNNLMNVTAVYAAVSDHEGFLKVPQPDYMVRSSFGSFELQKGPQTENIGQAIDYERNLVSVRTISIDSLKLPRVDMVKMDVEGMEEAALNGAKETIERCRPILCIEMIKSNRQKLAGFLQNAGYKLFPGGLNLIGIHQADPSLQQITPAS